LAESLGAEFNEKGTVDTGVCESTNVPGLYVAGDASKEAQFVIVAAAEGTKAATAINQALLKDDLAQKSTSNPRRKRRGEPYAKSG
jgi:thioredoxin reductase